MHNIRDLTVSNDVRNLHVAVKMYEYVCLVSSDFGLFHG